CGMIGGGVTVGGGAHASLLGDGKSETLKRELHFEQATSRPTCASVTRNLVWQCGQHIVIDILPPNRRKTPSREPSLCDTLLAFSSNVAHRTTSNPEEFPAFAILESQRSRHSTYNLFEARRFPQSAM